MRKMKKINLSDQLMDEIVSLIEEKQWEIGMKLPGELQLAESFNVSRNILREALKILETFGVLDSKPGIGTFVSAQANENIHNMKFLDSLKSMSSVETTLEMRLMIEPKAAYFAALRITEEEIQELKAFSERMLDQHESEQDRQEDFELHVKIAEYSKNPLCVNLIQSLLNQLKTTLYAEFNKYSNQKTKEENMNAHVAIIEAIIAHEADVAETLMLQHLSKRIKLINPEFEVEPNRP